MALPTRTIDLDLLIDLCYGDQEDDCDWSVAEKAITNTWRWGTEHSLILLAADGTYWGINYRATGGDEGGNDLRDQGDPVTLYPMVAEKVTSIKFRDMKESDATP